MTTPAKPADKKAAAAAQAANKKKVWKQGELEKQGGFHGGWKTWNKRWFVLNDDGVSYYKDEQAYLKGEKEKGYLHMDDQFAIKDQQDEVAHDERYFRIQSSGKTLIVKSKSLEDKRAWIEIVQKLKSVLIHNVYLQGGKAGATNGSAGQDNPFLDHKRVESEPLLSPTSKKMNSQSLKEGYLKKLGEKVQSWKQRYFVLLKDSLEYYKDDSVKSKQGSIRLTDQTLVTAINLPHTFTITPVPGGRKYVITAADDKQRDEWMARLHTLAGIKMTVIFPDKPKEAMKINTAEHEKALEKLLSGQESNKNAQQDFVNYCKSIFSEENVLFYLDVERYKKLDDQNDAAKLADVIASKYFEPGAEFEVAVPPQVKQQLMTDIKARKMAKTMFDHAQKILFQLILVDIVPKYLSRNPADVADTAKQAQEREEKESKVESCTLDQLMQAMTSVKLQDLNIRRALLLNYKQIIKAPDLLGRLEAVYLKDASTYEDARLCVGTKLLVVGVIQEWIRSYFNDIKEIMDAVNNCLKNWVDDAMKGIQAEMKSTSPSDGGWNILHSELRSTQALIDEMRDEEEAATEAKMLEDDDELIFEKAPERADICDYPVQMLANCMTMRDFKMFAAINPREFANKAWTRKETAPKNAANILKMVDEFNKRSFWVASEILNREDANERVRCIKHFVELADAAHDLHNFFAVFAIVSGLSMTPVLRLKQAWSKLSTTQKEKMEKLKQTTAVSYRAYRKIFKAGLGRAQIPHLAVTLKDCFQLEEISTIDENTGNINFGKFLKQYRELADLFQSQSIPYTLQTDKMVIAVLAACQMNLLKEEKMWQRSHRFEPKENKE